MAEDKKPKIDLKARLGRAQGAAGAATVPGTGRSPSSAVPPPAVGSVPPPAGWAGSPGSAPPQAGVPVPAAFGAPAGSAAPAAGGAGLGVPVPPFGQQASADPFGAAMGGRAARPVTAAAQTIKVEMDDEVVRAAARGGKKAAMMAGLAVIGGLVLGYAWGSRSASDRGAKIALQDAQELADQISQAQGKVKDLTEKIGGAIKSLHDKKFPDTFASDLGALSIPFGAEKLAGRAIGRFQSRTVQALFNYTYDIEALNDRKDALRNLFSGRKQAIIDAIAAGGNPQVTFAVAIQRSPAHGPVAVLGQLKDRFAYKDNWPNKLKLATGQEPDRYSAGDVFWSDKKPVAIPVDPDSIASAFPTDVIKQIEAELQKTRDVLEGKASGSDDEAGMGILKKGEMLLTDLRKIGKQ